MRSTPSAILSHDGTADVMRHDVIFLCETTEVAYRMLSLHGPEALVVDAAGCTNDLEGTPVVHMDINPHAAPTGGGVVAVPHGISAMLAELLHAVESGPGVRRATAMVLRPAADFGAEGLDELREQTVRLFNFAEEFEGEVPPRRSGPPRRRKLAFQLLLCFCQALLDRVRYFERQEGAKSSPVH